MHVDAICLHICNLEVCTHVDAKNLKIIDIFWHLPLFLLLPLSASSLRCALSCSLSAIDGSSRSVSGKTHRRCSHICLRVIHGLPMQRKAFSPPHWATATRPRRYENSDSKYGILHAISITQRQLSEHELQSDWFSPQWLELARQLVARQRVDHEPRSGPLVGRQIIVEFLAGSGSLGSFFYLSVSKVGCLRTSHLSRVHCKLLDVEKGCSEMEEDH